MNLKEINKPIEAHLKEFNLYFKNILKSDVSLLNLILQYITKKRGKQVRPALVFLSAELCGGVNNRSYIGAGLVELLHNATLVHDDVVDNSSIRRGMASINALWKNKVAVLIGDFLLAKGLLIAIDNNEFDFLHATSLSVRRMSEGELLQIQKSREISMDEETYYKIISNKTASLMASCCEVGAISATDDKEKQKLLRQFGEYLGISFQIQDDILDYKSKSSIIGKPIGNDLKEKKLTLPLIYSFTKVTKSQAKEISKEIKKGKLSKENIKKITNFVIENGGIEYAEKRAREFSTKAIETLASFKDSPAKSSLCGFADFVVDRHS